MAEKTSLRRRTFMAALGLGISAPLAMRMARRVEAAPTGAPVRLLNIFVPNGFPWERTNPVAYADPENPWGGGTLDLTLAGDDGVLTPLAPWQNYFNCVRGLAIDGINNHDACGAVLTGGASGGDSYDYLIAQELGVKAHVLGLSYEKTQGFGPFGHLAKHGGTYVRARENPIAAADEIFGSLGSDMNDMTAQNEAAFRAELMDLTSAQIGRMQEKVKGLTAAESKLQTHLEALASIREVSTPDSLSCTARPMMPLVDAAAGLDHADINNWRATIDAHLQLAGHAMYCGAAPVLTLHALPPSTDFVMNFTGGPGVGGGYHGGVSHGDRAGLAKCQRWVMERMAEVLMPILDQDDPTGSGKVIDNTIIYITSEVTDGDTHQSDSGIQAGTGYLGGPALKFNGQDAWNGGSIYAAFPSFVIGGGGGCFKTGGNDIALAQSAQTGGRPNGDLLATIAHAMGASSVRNLGGERSLIEELMV